MIDNINEHKTREKDCDQLITIDNTALECAREFGHSGKCVTTFEVLQGPGPMHVYECVLSWSKTK